MTDRQQPHCEHECVCPDYAASHSDYEEDPDPCDLPCMQRSSHSSATEPAERISLSFPALMGIHRELSNINDMTSHISDLLTPLRQSVSEHDAATAQAAREEMLDELLAYLKKEGEVYTEYYLNESGYDILANFEQYLESLRSGVKQVRPCRFRGERE